MRMELRLRCSVAEAGGDKFNRAGYEKESKREEEARAKAAAAKK